MNICFFCYTPFHVFNAISVKHNLYPNDAADLYLFNSVSGGTNVLYENIVAISLFRNVYKIDSLRWKHYSKAQKLLHLHERFFHINKKIINAKKNYKKLKKANRVYDEVWSYGSEMELYLILGISLRSNPKTQYKCYEEGEGSYRLPCTNALKNNEISYLENKLHIKMPEIPNLMLFYLPSCVSPIVTAPIDNMPLVSKELLNDIYPKIWHYNPNTINYDVFFMALADPDQSFAVSIYEMLQSYNSINVTIKAHPRYTAPFIGKDIELLDCGTTPWEIVCGGIDKIESRLLIGVYSTALITAKSVYNKEPFIIFLNEMDSLKDNQRITKEKEEILENFIQTYSDKSKIFIPKTLEELYDCVSVWKKEIHGN